MKEEQYSEMIKKLLLEQEDKYFTDIKHDKYTVWERIESKLDKKKIIPLWIYFAAAVILLILGMSFIFKYQLQKKDIEIANLKSQVERKKTQFEIAYIEPFYKPNHSDSHYLVNKKIVYLPVKLIDTIVLYDTINKFVLRTDTVFINEKANEQIAIKEATENEKLVDNNIVVNQKVKEKKRERRFIFKIGKSKDDFFPNETQTYQNRGLITLKSK